MSRMFAVTVEGGTLDPEDAFAPQNVDSLAGRAALHDQIDQALDANVTKVIATLSE
jgi:hypothetical protein